MNNSVAQNNEKFSEVFMNIFSKLFVIRRLRNIPESLGIAFCTNSRLVVRTPFSVTNDIPPRGESKLIVCECTRREKNGYLDKSKKKFL
jgi:hypothetical protein